MATLRTVTVRRLLNTAAFGKPEPTPSERRNSLVWGHPAPLPEHNVLVLLAGMLALLLAAATFAGIIVHEGEARSEPAGPTTPLPRTSVVIIAPLA